jgi:hypothetical protein
MSLFDDPSCHFSQNDHGRLGLSNPPKATLLDVPFPSRLRIPGVRIVSLVAGGMFVPSCLFLTHER